MSSSLIAVLLSVLLASVGIVIIFVAVRIVKKGKFSERIQNFVVDSERRIGIDSDEGHFTPMPMRELEGGILQRTVFTWVKNLVNYMERFTPQSSIYEMNRKLAIMGNPYNMRAREFFSLRVLLAIFGLILSVLFLRFTPLDTRSGLIAILIFLIFIFIPSLWLFSGVRKAKDKIRRSLPDALDMLSVCASAGLGFDQSLQKVSENWRTKLGTEFRRVSQEMEVGIPRSEALRNMATRLDVGEVSSFVAVIVQADHLGMQIADVLHSQADQMRILRQFRAKEIANKLPAKMMVPLAFCILPALIGVILGPMLPQFFEMLGGL